MSLVHILSSYDRITPENYGNFDKFQTYILSKPLSFYLSNSLTIENIIDEEYRKYQKGNIINKYKIEDDISLIDFLENKLFANIVDILNFSEQDINGEESIKIDFKFLLSISLINKLSNIGHRYLCGRKYKKHVSLPKDFMGRIPEIIYFGYLLYCDIDVVTYN